MIAKGLKTHKQDNTIQTVKLQTVKHSRQNAESKWKDATHCI